MQIEEELEKYFDRLWPICRSITGNGLRESLHILQELIPLNLTEVPTGTKCFDWEIPKEWNIKDAYIVTPEGKKICQFKLNNLHVVNYSVSVNEMLEYDKLLPYLHFLENLPDAVPYITSYYHESWGFCLSYNEFKELPKTGIYKVFIDSTLEPGNLTYGDLVLQGESDKEILLSTYLCHPSMANNELSGPLCMAFLYRKIAMLPRRKYTYRFVIAPETIGVIHYLSVHGNKMKENIIAGYVMTCCGDGAPFVYKRSKRGNSLSDKIAQHVLFQGDDLYSIINFAVGGSDERQYCSPGFNLPVGSLTRSMYQKYNEYHTSADNKSFISFVAMVKTIDVYFNFVRALELNSIYETIIRYGEPHLGKRGLYPSTSDLKTDKEYTHNLLHLLTYSDGKTDLLDISEMRGCSIFKFEQIVYDAKKAELIFEK